MLHWRRGAKTVGSDLDQHQNWLLSVPSSTSMLGLGRQICHHAKVDSKSICANESCDRDVGISDGNCLLHWRRGAKTVGSVLDQQQNWLLSVPSSPSVLGLGRQICHHAEVDSKTICTNERCDRDVGISDGNLLLHWRRGAKAVGSNLDQQQNWLLSVPSSPSILGLTRQFRHHAEVDAKTTCTNKRCDRDVRHQMATFCYTGATVQKRLAVTSINNRTGCCLCRLPHQCSDWGGKSVIMQRSTQKPPAPTKDVTVTLGTRWHFLLHWRRGAKTVGSDHDQQQNWLLSLPSSPSMLGLGWQICHHAEIDSKIQLCQRKV